MYINLILCNNKVGLPLVLTETMAFLNRENYLLLGGHFFVLIYGQLMLASRLAASPPKLIKKAGELTSSIEAMDDSSSFGIFK